MENNNIPLDLFPLRDKDYDTQWALDTYQHRRHFNTSVQSNVGEDEELEDWIREGRKIANSLKCDGIMYAEKQIIDMCNGFYNSYFVNRNFQNMFEVTNLFSDKEFVAQNNELYFNMLHMFQYGIFRCAFNGWAIDAATAWMKRHRIDYEKKSLTVKSKHTRRGKGCIYKLLVSRASNTICVRFQHITLRDHGEYVIVRDKKKECVMKGYTVIKHVFNHNYNGYIVRKSDVIVKESDECLSCEEKQTLIHLVNEVIKSGKSFENITQLLENCAQDKTNGE